MSKNYNNLIEALEARAEVLRAKDEADLLWVLLDDAADTIKVLTGKQHLDRILSHGTTDRLIEAQAAEIERLEALFTNSTYEAKAMMEEIDRRGAEIQALREMQGKDSHDQ